MKIDLYTKTILTVIAIALSAIAFQNVNFVSTAKANTNTTTQTTIPIVTQETPVDVNISHIGGVPIMNYHPYASDRKPYHKEINLYYDGIPVTIEKNRDK